MTITIRRVHVVAATIMVLIGVGAFLLGRTTAPSSSPRIAASHTTSTPASTTVSAPATSLTTVPASTTIMQTTTTTTTPPPIFSAGNYSGREPATIDNSPGCCSVIDHITWSVWSAAQAQGRGTFEYDTCADGCVRGPFDPYPATVTLSGPEGGQFTVLIEDIEGSPQAGVSTWTYPSSWPFGGS
jgi:hypothetical protein